MLLDGVCTAFNCVSTDWIACGSLLRKSFDYRWLRLAIVHTFPTISHRYTVEPLRLQFQIIHCTTIAHISHISTRLFIYRYHAEWIRCNMIYFWAMPHFCSPTNHTANWWNSLVSHSIPHRIQAHSKVIILMLN